MARTISQVMSRQVEVIRPDAPLRDAAMTMKSLDVGSVPVCDGERLVGMLTDRDIAIRAVARDRGPETPVREAMTPEVAYCFEDDAIDKAAELMKEKQIRRLPILNREKRLVGILALGDIAQATPAKKSGEVLEKVSEPSEGGRRSV